ncbi:GGDEF domain protein [Methylophaga frappieri]|uniref:diguanylate cyclase n=1 Tax=Methylophaga frappieri (strain ATCC BAA-2434 / DSM 25690 / JAM7) TaxID=754477 RepID=I1YL86_METFJ|nr:GGDEF domain protein [Methylophaga frappieri]
MLAAELSVDHPSSSLGQFAEIFFEPEEIMTSAQAKHLFAEQAGVAIKETTPNFGIGARPHWLSVTVNNPHEIMVERFLSVENAWLDDLQVFVFYQDKLESQFSMGDSYPFATRPYFSRFFDMPIQFKPGQTTLLVRVATPDPMMLPIYLNDAAAQAQRQEFDQYSYGLLYGFLAALMLYNLMLFLGLRSLPHLFYTLYLAACILCNMAYTGHAFWWFWPDMVVWQKWSNPTLMMSYCVTGLLFALTFLKTRKMLPRLHWMVSGFCVLMVVGFVGAFYADWIQVALVLAFIFILLFACLMIVLGVLAIKAGNPSGRFFLLASIVSMLTAAVSSLSVWGWIPYSFWTFRAVEAGTMVEAVLLALALADHFRRVEKHKTRAEGLARTDPLTGIYNRRAFYDQVRSLWLAGMTEGKPMSLLLIDLDNFKQVNDNYGHQVGDEVLAKTAKVVEASLRNEDVLARWGGEEFIVFMPNTSLSDALRVAERIRFQISALAAQFDTTQKMQLSASLGVVDNRSAADSLESLIKAADQCLYHAKNGGRNCVISASLSAV